MLLLLVSITFAWNVVVTVDYYNPSAKSALAPPILKLKIIGNVNPISNTINISSISLNLGVNNTQINRLITQRLNESISKCTYQSTPLIRAVMCTIQAIKDVIGISYISPKSVGATTFTTIDGVMGYKYSANVDAMIVGKRFLGFVVYTSYAYMRNFLERLYLSAASANGYLVIRGQAGSRGLPANYYKIVAPNATGILVLLSKPLVKPKLISVGNDVLVSVQRPIISYAVIYKNGALLPEATWLYYSKPSNKILLPVKFASLVRSALKSPSSVNLCRAYLTVALPGEHNVTVDTASYKLSVKVKGYARSSIPIPCNGTYILKIDRSVALLNSTTSIEKSFVVYPTAPTLIPTLLKANSPFLIVTRYGIIECPPTCYLLRPPSKMEITVSDLSKTNAVSLALPPVISAANIKLMPNLPGKGCTITLVSPVQTYAQLYVGKSSLVSLTVGPKPTTVAVPCNRAITVKVASYTTTFTPNNKAWVYLCPLSYGSQGTTITINTTGMVPPLAVSCDGGLHWADVKATQFLMLKPALASMHLVIIDKNGAKSSLIVTRGVSKLNVFPIEKVTGSKLKPFVGNDLVPVEVTVSGLTNGTVTLMFMNGNEYVEYAISNPTVRLGLPKAWLTSKLTLQIGRGLELHKVVLPPLKTGQRVSPIYVLLWNKLPYNYHSLKVIVLRGKEPIITPININGFKTIIKGSAVFVMPNNTARIKVGGEEMVVPANGQAVTLTLRPPQQLTLGASVDIITILNSRSVTSKVSFSDGKTTLTYTVPGKAVVLLPPQWLKRTLAVSVISGTVACETKIPPLMTSFITGNLTSPLVSILKEGAPECYSIKLVLTKSSIVKSPAEAQIILDGKYKIHIKGSVVIIYYKPEANITINGKTYKLLLDGSTARLVVTHKVKPRKPKISNVTVSVSLVTALKKAGKWNPVKELPALLSLSTAFALSLGVLNSGVEPTTAWGSIAYALAAFNILVIVALVVSILTMYFQTG